VGIVTGIAEKGAKSGAEKESSNVAE
jgi:hypothetical protein